VDAAFQCFPIEGLRKFAAMGADITAYSCKYFGGPNTAGILVGKKDLINTIALHSFIGQEGGPGGKILLETIPNKPHGSVFRGCKMDRASITGAVASLEEHLTTDYENIFNKAQEKIEILKQAWNNIPGVNYEVSEIGTVAQEPGRISLHLILDKTPEETNEIVIKLMNGNPSIWASSQGNHLVINITSFRGLMLADESDTGLIIERIKSILTK
jgi:seryl-tRNA(Sec) selenium transferase